MKAKKRKSRFRLPKKEMLEAFSKLERKEKKKTGKSEIFQKESAEKKRISLKSTAEKKRKDFQPKEISRKQGKSILLSADHLTRLNKFIADAGICSRREADVLIQSGAIRVNGKTVTVLGTKVGPNDKVQYGDETLRREKFRYLLLNKPRNYITTTDDPEERKTVMQLVQNACNERIYPVGRLDRHTTGVLLFTNDGDLAKKLTHPSHRIRKMYHVHLDKSLTKADFIKVAEGIELEDGFIKVDKIDFIENTKGNKEVGIELHSGKNRIVRRIFESLGYQVTRLDRVMFANLTKKDLPKGKWRFLSEKEISFLKML